MMSQETTTSSQRERWFDIARGICSVMVVLAHVQNVPMVYYMFLSPFMLPVFFAISGYFSRLKDVRLIDYLYYKTLKSLFLKLIFSVSLTTLSLQVIFNLFAKPETIPVWLWNTLSTAFLKPRAIFFSIVVLCSVFLFVIDKICMDKPVPMLIAGAISAAVGWTVSKPWVVRLWSWDTALVCVFFFIIGYCASKSKFLTSFHFKPIHTMITGAAYFGAVAVSALIFGVDGTAITVAINKWGNPMISMPLMLLGTSFIVSLSNTIDETSGIARLLSYIGRHAFTCFMFGGPILAYLWYFLGLFLHACGRSLPDETYLISLVFTAIAVSITLVICRFCDRFLPVVNGDFRMPDASPRPYPKVWITACAAVVIAGTGLFCLARNGIWIPNNIYAKDYEIKGVDVSSYQGDIDWPRLASQDIDFAFVKATEGSGHVDAKFEYNWKGAADAGLRVGAYHFFSFDSSGADQAKNYISHVPVSDSSLPPVVDVEFYGDKAIHPPDEQSVLRELTALLDALEKHYGKKPIIYAPDDTFNIYIIQKLEQYPFWTRNIVTDPNNTIWSFWQYTSRQKLEGYDGAEEFIDMNVFIGSPDDFAGL